jgi:hypothetical protein
MGGGTGGPDGDDMNAPAHFVATFTKATSGSINLTIAGSTKQPNYEMNVYFRVHSCGTSTCSIEVEAMQLDTIGSTVWGTIEMNDGNASLPVAETTTLYMSNDTFSFAADSVGMNSHWYQTPRGEAEEFWSLWVSNGSTFYGDLNSDSAPTTLKLDGTFTGSLYSISAAIDLNEIVGSVSAL